MPMPKRNTKRWFLYSFHAEGLTQQETFERIRPLVLSQSRPWIFSANVKGQGRVPKSVSEQLIDLNHEISRVWSLIEREGNNVPAGEFKAPEQETPESTPEPEQEIPKPRKKTSVKEDEKHFFFHEWKRIREWIASQVSIHGVAPVDSLDTMRPVIEARRGIDAGISARALLYSMVAHWPKTSRENANVSEVDFTNECDPMGEEIHRMAGYVLKLATARIPVMLIGPAGTGKSHLAQQVASMIRTESHPDGLPYGETPMTPGATRGDLLGRMTASPDKSDRFVLSRFVEIYSGGGVFNFEEIDASDPGMLIVVNNALASGRLFNSVNGEVYTRHPDFVPMATANTFGMGADAKYTGREKLDLATIDRFRMGRVILNLDEALAERMMFG